MKDEKNIKKDILPIFAMALLLVSIQFIALFLVSPFETAGMQTFENPSNPTNILYIIVLLALFTAIILLIAKFWKKKVIQAIVMAAIGYTSAYVFYPLFNIFFIDIYSAFFSIVMAVSLIVVLYYYPEWYIIDITGIIIGSGAIAIFGISLSILLTIILLVVLALYDAISVYKTKHMIELADTVMDLKLPVLLAVPKRKGYSLIKEKKGLKKKMEDEEERDAFFMGLGDIVMPGILAAAVYNNVKHGLPLSVSVIIGTLIGFSILMIFVIKGKSQAGLPLMCGGAIAGYLISSYIMYGKLVGLTLPV